MGTRVEVPVIFEDITTLVLLFAACILIPALIAFIISWIVAIKNESPRSHVIKPTLSAMGSGVVLSILVGAVMLGFYPYAAQKEAFQEVSAYYNTNLASRDAGLPVKLFADSEVESPVEVTVYRVAGGNPESCLVYADDYYVLFCGSPLTEYQP